MKFTTIVRRAALVAALVLPATAAASPDQTAGKQSMAAKKTPTAKQNVPKPGAKQLSDTDRQVLNTIHTANQNEIAMGKLAETRGTRAVKAYGATLIKDHQKADKDVLAIAKTHNEQLTGNSMPTDPAEADQMKKDMATMNRLKTLEGVTFEQEFLTAMIDGHTRLLATIDKAVATTDNAKVKTLLNRMKPVVQRHADQAKALQAPRKQAMK